MNFLTAASFLCLASCALASGVSPYFPGVLPHGGLALGGVGHYATVPVGRAVAYGSTINHGAVVGVGLAPYGYKYGLGLAAPASVAALKYGVAAAPFGAVNYGVAAAPLAAAPLLHAPVAAAPLLHAPVAAAPLAAVKYGVAAAPLGAVHYGFPAAPVVAAKYGVAAAPLAVAPAYAQGLYKGHAVAPVYAQGLYKGHPF